MLRITALLNPISRDVIQTEVEAGTPLHQQMKIPGDCLVYRNGEPYQGEPLHDDDLITVVKAPQGGDQGKDIARTGVIISAIIASQFIFPGNPSLAAGISLGNALGRAAFVGAIAIGANSLLPPEDL